MVMATTVTVSILSYHTLHSSQKELIHMRGRKMVFALLNVQAHTCLFSCACSRMQALKLSNSELQ